MDHILKIASKLNIRQGQVSAAVELFDSGNTLPFIARYRKEATGGLDEEQLRDIQNMIESLRSLDERRDSILKSIAEQGKLSPELKQDLLSADTMTRLEDLYQPYKPKRKTRASVAREKGLQGLAEAILRQDVTGSTVNQLASNYLSAEVASVEDAINGAQDIVAEVISDNPDVRRMVREKALTWGSIKSEKVKDSEDPRNVYEVYYEFEYRIDQIKPHQVLALERGETEKVLKVIVNIPERDWRNAIAAVFRINPRSVFAEHLQLAIDDASNRLLLPTIERDVRKILKERAEAHAIAVFASNLKALLYQPPLSGQIVLGIDPGFRTGCKIAVIDSTGKVLETATIYPHEPQKKWQEAKEILVTMIDKHSVTLLSIGNGTASRESEKLAAEVIRDKPNVKYVITNEAGASVYSASVLARKEFPDMDVSLRGAVSIARRIQDPLPELVKIDPKSIGVGLYQHDVDQGKLSKTLDGVVESVVNQVGVDLNTASPALLNYVAGIGPKLAENIVQYREENGPYRSRKRLMKVPGLGPKAFEQSAGFLRIRGGDNPFDTSAIHPESYHIAEAILKLAGLSMDTPIEKRRNILEDYLAQKPAKVLAEELHSGEMTLNDILEQLVRPGRDPREDLPAPILRSDVLSIDDLSQNMILNGTVRNVVDFGAFVDIGVKCDGLLHRTQVPRDVQLSVGNVIQVKILNIEIDRGRISLGWVDLR